MQQKLNQFSITGVSAADFTPLTLKAVPAPPVYSSINSEFPASAQHGGWSGQGAQQKGTAPSSQRWCSALLPTAATQPQRCLLHGLGVSAGLMESAAA